MDDTIDAASLGQQAVRLGLITQNQLELAIQETGTPTPAAHDLVRVLERLAFLTQWQSSKLIRGDSDGYFLGGYRVLYKIASGSFGRVFRADDPSSGRVVAIKVLRRRWSEDQQRIDLFEREGKVGMSLKHPNIVEILAVGKDQTSGQFFIIMEFVEGGNLREILQIRGKFTVPEALRIIEEAATGLAYAYSQGVTHRDMKLTNILIASQGAAKLVDFGLAQFFPGGHEETKEKDKDKEKVERTVDYAGLERATGVKTGDVRSDIYFLGCVLYEILTGKSPLVMTRDRHQRMQKQRFDSVPPMNSTGVSVPTSVSLLVETMMSLDPHQRYQTPSQLVDAIKAARRDVEGRAAAGNGSVNHSLFIVEKEERWQDVFRDKFKKLGYRVFLSGDPGRAADRFRQHPYDGLVIDIGTVGEEGLVFFENIMLDAARKNIPCAGIVIFAPDQTDWSTRITARPNVAILTMPVNVKQLHRKLTELLR